MALDKSVIKTIALVAVFVVVAVILLGVGLALWLPRRFVSLDFFPKPEDTSSSLIYFKVSDVGSVNSWVRRVDEFFEEYSGNKPEARFRQDCSARSYLLSGELVCDVKILKHGPCSSQNIYSYRYGTPCVFVRLTQVSGWVPESYNNSYRLPHDMPEDLKMHIRNLRNGPEANKVWVTCHGENSLDQENIGPVQYYPDRGLPAYYFPYSNKEGYLSPYVAVHFERPKPGVLVNVECRAWAHNIQYDRYQQRGSVHFEIMVDY